MSQRHPPLVAIVGPTGVGKSDVALALARRFFGEVVNADSRLLYRGMDIGTAKPTPQARARVPHHLVDLVEPDQEFNLARYLELARATVDDAHRRGRVPFLVGGTGLYVWGLLEGLRAPHVAPNPTLRRELEQWARRDGLQALHQDLERRDPVAASRIDPRNLRRIIRALEVCMETGLPFSQLQRREPPPYATLVLGLTMERRELYQRLDQRAEEMARAGWLQEVEALRRKGYGSELPAMSALGYREMLACVEGRLSLEEALRRIKKGTRRFARRQYAWFRPADARIRWLEPGPQIQPQAEGLVAEFLAQHKGPC